MKTRKEFTKEEMQFVMQIVDSGLEGDEDNNKFEEIKERAWKE